MSEGTVQGPEPALFSRQVIQQLQDCIIATTERLAPGAGAGVLHFEQAVKQDALLVQALGGGHSVRKCVEEQIRVLVDAGHLRKCRECFRGSGIVFLSDAARIAVAKKRQQLERAAWQVQRNQAREAAAAAQRAQQQGNGIRGSGRRGNRQVNGDQQGANAPKRRADDTAGITRLGPPIKKPRAPAPSKPQPNWASLTHAQLLALVEQQEAQLRQQGAQLRQQGAQLKEQGVQLEQQEAQLEQQGAELEQKDAQLKRRGDKLWELLRKVAQKDAELEQQGTQLQQHHARVAQQDAQLRQQEAQLQQQSAQLRQQRARLEQQEAQLWQQEAQLGRKDTLLEQQEEQLQKQAARLRQQEAQLRQQRARLQQQDAQLQQNEAIVAEVSAKLATLPGGGVKGDCCPAAGAAAGAGGRRAQPAPPAAPAAGRQPLGARQGPTPLAAAAAAAAGGRDAQPPIRPRPLGGRAAPAAAAGGRQPLGARPRANAPAAAAAADGQRSSRSKDTLSSQEPSVSVSTAATDTDSDAESDADTDASDATDATPQQQQQQQPNERRAGPESPSDIVAAAWHQWDQLLGGQRGLSTVTRGKYAGLLAAAGMTVRELAQVRPELLGGWHRFVMRGIPGAHFKVIHTLARQRVAAAYLS